MMNKVMPYWMQLCEWSGQLDGCSPFGPLAAADRQHGELMAGIIDRLRELGAPTEEVMGAFREVSNELMNCAAGLKAEVRKTMAQSRFAAADVERVAVIAAALQRMEHIQQFTDALEDSGQGMGYTILRERSIHLLSDLTRVYTFMGLLDADRRPFDLRLNELRQAIRRLTNEFGNMMLACYIDYFDERTPTHLNHLAGMLQCAAILQQVSDVELLITEEQHTGGHVHYTGSMYRDLFDWFQDAPRSIAPAELSLGTEEDVESESAF